MEETLWFSSIVHVCGSVRLAVDGKASPVVAGKRNKSWGNGKQHTAKKLIQEPCRGRETESWAVVICCVL